MSDGNTSSLDTRSKIMRALKIGGGSTVTELAAQAEVSPVTVRHHLGSLQADHLVTATVERRSVGRPHHVFHLTDAGEETFPRQYLNLTKRLLDQMKANLPADTISDLFERMARQITATHSATLEGKSQGERLALLSEILEAEGFMVSLEESGNGTRIIEHNCPYRNLGRRHPDVCMLDQALIDTVLETRSERTSCMLNGDQRCVYVVQVGQHGVP